MITLVLCFLSKYNVRAEVKSMFTSGDHASWNYWDKSCVWTRSWKICRNTHLQCKFWFSLLSCHSCHAWVSAVIEVIQEKLHLSIYVCLQRYLNQDIAQCLDKTSNNLWCYCHRMIVSSDVTLWHCSDSILDIALKIWTSIRISHKMFCISMLNRIRNCTAMEGSC